MKKLLFIVALTFVFSNTSNAQNTTSTQTTTSKDGISFGAKAGVNFATLSKDEGFKPDNKTGFHVGAVAEIPITEKFLIQPEVVFSSQGFKESDEGVTYTVKLNYINVPVMAGYRIIEGLTAQAGPQFGINISAKEVNDFNDDDLDIKDNIKTLDIGFGFGAQYELDFGLFFQARYTLGLNKVFDFDESPDFKNRVASLSVGYFFN